MTAHNIAGCTYTIRYFPMSILDYKPLFLRPIGMFSFNLKEDTIVCEGRYCFFQSSDMYSTKQYTWKEQEAFCQSHGTHLLSINSKTEQYEVLKLLYEQYLPAKGGTDYDRDYSWFRMLPLVSIIFLGLQKVS